MVEHIWRTGTIEESHCPLPPYWSICHTDVTTTNIYTLEEGPILEKHPQIITYTVHNKLLLCCVNRVDLIAYRAHDTIYH